MQFQPYLVFLVQDLWNATVYNSRRVEWQLIQYPALHGHWSVSAVESRTHQFASALETPDQPA